MLEGKKDVGERSGTMLLNCLSAYPGDLRGRPGGKKSSGTNKTARLKRIVSPRERVKKKVPPGPPLTPIQEYRKILGDVG